MKKLLAALVFVLVLTGAVVAYAGGGMIGKTVDAVYPFYADGTRSPVDAIGIEGTSYIPVRAAGEMFGYDVGFSDDVIALNRVVSTQEVVSSIDIKGVDKMENYKVVCNVAEVDQPYLYKIIDGEWFYPPASFINRITSEGDIFTITMPWDTVTFDASQEYSPGMVGGKIDGRTFVSLSALGLKPVIKGDEVWLERIE
jgi:hypothetical protein